MRKPPAADRSGERIEHRRRIIPADARIGDRHARRQRLAGHQVLAALLIAATAITEIYLTSGNTLRLDATNFWPAAMWVIVYLPALPSLMLA